MTSDRDQESLHDYLGSGKSNLQWELFRKRFIDFLSDYDPDDEDVTPAHRKALFGIVQRHLKKQAGMQAVNQNKQKLEQDYGACEKLMGKTKEGVNKLLLYLGQPSSVKGFCSATLARSITKEVTEWKTSLEDRFEYEQHVFINPQKSMLSTITASSKDWQRELTIDLLRFIRLNFPGFTNQKRDVLIAATLVGAALSPEKVAGKDSDMVERVPMKVSRARKHLKRFYTDPGEEQGYATGVPGRKKKQSTGTRQKGRDGKS